MAMASKSLGMAILLFMWVFCRRVSAQKAIIVFGDSTVDTGNSNYAGNAIRFRADRLPYGRDLSPPHATGRFSNGKLPTDIIADLLGVPVPVEYYSDNANIGNMLKGINFASAGSGYLSQTGSISLSQQFKNFENVQHNISAAIGEEKMRQWAADAIYLMSTGGNDVVSYNVNPFAQALQSPQQFDNMLAGSALDHVKSLYNMGARKMVIAGSGPLGCPPLMLTIFGSPDGSCIQSVNDEARLYNAALKAGLQDLSSKLAGSVIVYGDIYTPVMNAIQHPANYGFKVSDAACCGMGKYGGIPPCSSARVCKNADEYVFWDSIHPTQAVYQIISEGLYSGNLASPLNILELARLP